LVLPRSKPCSATARDPERKELRQPEMGIYPSFCLSYGERASILTHNVTHEHSQNRCDGKERGSSNQEVPEQYGGGNFRAAVSGYKRYVHLLLFVSHALR
jgi:hypothetical protein